LSTQAFILVFMPPALVAFGVVWWRNPSRGSWGRWSVGLLAGWVLIASVLEATGSNDALSEGIAAGLLRYTEPPGEFVQPLQGQIRASFRSWLNVAGLTISGLVLLALVRLLARDVWDRLSNINLRVDTMVVGLNETGLALVSDLMSDLAVRDHFKPGRIVAIEQFGDESRSASVRALGVPVVKVEPGDIGTIMALGTSGGFARLRRRKWTARNIFLTSNDVITNIRLADAISAKAADLDAEQGSERRSNPGDARRLSRTETTQMVKMTIPSQKEGFDLHVLHPDRRKPVRIGVYVAESDIIDELRGRQDRPFEGQPAVSDHHRSTDMWYFCPAEASARALAQLVEHSLDIHETTRTPEKDPIWRIALLGTGVLQNAFLRDLRTTHQLLKIKTGNTEANGSAAVQSVHKSFHVSWYPLYGSGPIPTGTPSSEDLGVPNDIGELVDAVDPWVSWLPTAAHDPETVTCQLGNQLAEADLVVVDGTSSNSHTARLLRAVVKPTCTVVVCEANSSDADTDLGEAEDLRGHKVTTRTLTIDPTKGISRPGQFVLLEVDPLHRATHDFYRWGRKDRSSDDPFNQEWLSPFLHPYGRQDTVDQWDLRKELLHLCWPDEGSTAVETGNGNSTELPQGTTFRLVRTPPAGSAIQSVTLPPSVVDQLTAMEHLRFVMGRHSGELSREQLGNELDGWLKDDKNGKVKNDEQLHKQLSVILPAIGLILLQESCEHATPEVKGETQVTSD
jgi:hypothetical protein